MPRSPVVTPGVGAAWIAAVGTATVAPLLVTSAAAVEPDVAAIGAAEVSAQPNTVEPLTSDAPQAFHLLRNRRVPAGIGVVVLLVAVFALVLGNPFRAGGVQGVLDATDTPSASSSGQASEPTTTETPDAGSGSVTPATNEPPATDSGGQPAGAPAPTSRPAATPTLPPGRTPAPPGTTPAPTATPTPTATPPQPTPTPTPTPAPTPPPTPTPAPTPTPPPACRTVPNMVGLTIAKARNAWSRAGFTGAFSAPPGAPGKAIVTSQSQPAGSCLPATTGINVTT